jgi:Family of unknown function (DUF6236)
VTTGVALYYPYVHIRSEQWLKMALLYWESVRRIVPRNFQPEHDEKYGSKVAVAEGLVESTPPDKYVEQAGERFRATVLPQLKQELQRKGFPLAQKLKDALNTQEQRLDYEIHPDKLDQTLIEELTALEVAARTEGPDLVVRPDVGIAYMLCLAQVMSDGLHAEPVTHDPAIAQLNTAFSFQPDETAGIPAVVTLDLPFPNATALADVPWKKIIAFRKDHEDQRLEFRKTINEVAEKLPHDADPDAIKDTIEGERQRLRIALREHKKAMDRLITSTAASSFQIGIPTLFAKGLEATTLPKESVITLTATAVAIVGVGWWARYKGERAKLLASPYQYLLSVKGLKPSRWRRITGR